MYALLSETTMASKKTSYSEKVAVMSKEATFTRNGHDDDEQNQEQDQELQATTAMVSVDDDDDDVDDVVQGEVVSSQIITSRYVWISEMY